MFINAALLSIICIIIPHERKPCSDRGQHDILGAWGMSSLAQVLEEKYDAQQLCVLMACKRLDAAKTDMSGKVVGSAVLTADRFDGLCAAFSSALKYFDGLRTLFADVYKAWDWMTK